MKFLPFLFLLSSCTSSNCISNAEAERESNLAEYRKDFYSRKISFSEFENLRDNRLVIEKMVKLNCK